MLRSLCQVALVFGLLSLAGCGKSNDVIAEEMIGAINELSDALDTADKTKIQAASTKFSNLMKKHKDKKVTEAENKRVMDKYKPQMEAAMKRMMGSMMKASTSGKLTQQDMQEIMEPMKSLGK